ncbi:hypothetical protein [Frigoriglobus tundricola]|uniref:hypothetical protein n=1 Tax=Frigoriglobus tundricola TaxID=2774151 RepID=UPI00148EA531|nr:hypothetical protein [Frigoriglobus tundricola]
MGGSSTKPVRSDAEEHQPEPPKSARLVQERDLIQLVQGDRFQYEPHRRATGAQRCDFSSRSEESGSSGPHYEERGDGEYTTEDDRGLEQAPVSVRVGSAEVTKYGAEQFGPLKSQMAGRFDSESEGGGSDHEPRST